MAKLKRVLIVAGGTGGHVMPGLAVTEILKKEAGLELAWLGTRHGLEGRLVKAAHIRYFAVTGRGLRGKSRLRTFINALLLFVSAWQALIVFLRFRPQLVICFGGYVTGPAALLTKVLRKPLLIHEQNAVLGWTNRLLSRVAQRVLLSYQQALPKAPSVFVTGNPVRENLLNLPKPRERLELRCGMRLLIIGGSQGALALNQLLPKTVAKLIGINGLEIWHQSGTYDFEATKDAYAELDVSARVEPFIDDMQGAYVWADLVLARAGASTIAELAAVGLGSLLVPFPHAVDDHQTANAQQLVATGAAILLPQKELTEALLANTIRTLAKDRQQLLQMANAAYELANRQAASVICEHILECYP